MLFNSTEFLVFLAVVLCLYQTVRKNIPVRNGFILLASYVFYGWWSIGFLGLMIGTSCLDYYLGRAIGIATTRRRALLVSSLAVNLGILFYFKYSAFAWQSASDLLESFGYRALESRVAPELPVGISFYIFQSLSFVIDVYRGRIAPPEKLREYLAYVAFFPQLVAGPIERSPHLLPQFRQALPVTGAQVDEGFWLILWGLFKKVVIADNLAPYVDLVYGNPQNSTAPLLMAATVGFGVQIYCDFSGYSDIARGLGKLFGFDIMFNFRIPYGARDIREFWNRWHISLSTWFRDYLYVPLGGNRKGLPRTALNLLAVMLVAGLWHGASVTFVLWGLLHGAALVVARLWSALRPASLTLPRPVSWLATMFVVFFGWIFFRAGSTPDLYLLLSSVTSWARPEWFGAYTWGLSVYCGMLVLMEMYLSWKADLLAPLAMGRWSKALLQGAMLLLVVIYWDREGTPFIYFQF